jgi:hypothetical protein
MLLATWESIFGMHMACNLIIESGKSDGREKMKPSENADYGPFQLVTLDTSRGIPVFETGAFSQALPPLRSGSAQSWTVNTNSVRLVQEQTR